MARRAEEPRRPATKMMLRPGGWWVQRRPPVHPTDRVILGLRDWTTAQRFRPKTGGFWDHARSILPLARAIGGKGTIVDFGPPAESTLWAPGGYPVLNPGNMNSLRGDEHSLKRAARKARALGLEVMFDLPGIRALYPRDPPNWPKDQPGSDLGGTRQIWGGPEQHPLPEMLTRWGVGPQDIDARTARPEVAQALGLKKGIYPVFPGFVEILPHRTFAERLAGISLLIMEYCADHFRLDAAGFRDVDDTRRLVKAVRHGKPEALIFAEVWRTPDDPKNPAAHRGYAGPIARAANVAVGDAGQKALVQQMFGENEHLPTGNGHRWHLYDVSKHFPPGSSYPQQPGLAGMPGHGGWSVTHAENWDSGPSVAVDEATQERAYPADADLRRHWPVKGQSRWPLLNGTELAANAYVILSRGIPSAYYDHLFESGPDARDDMARLVRIRRSLAIDADSPVHIFDPRNGSDGYAAHRMDGRLGAAIVKVGPGHGFRAPADEGGPWYLATTGPEYAVWVDRRGKRELARLTAHARTGGGDGSFVWDQAAFTNSRRWKGMLAGLKLNPALDRAALFDDAAVRVQAEVVSALSPTPLVGPTYRTASASLVTIEDRDTIGRAQLIRRALAIDPSSKHQVLGLKYGLPETEYYAYLVEGRSGAAIVKAGPSFAFNAPEGYTLALAGRDYAVWVDGRGVQAVTEVRQRVCDASAARRTYNGFVCADDVPDDRLRTQGMLAGVKLDDTVQGEAEAARLR